MRREESGRFKTKRFSDTDLRRLKSEQGKWCYCVDRDRRGERDVGDGAHEHQVVCQGEGVACHNRLHCVLRDAMMINPASAKI